ncbi:MAG TPA: ATP-binding protein [Parafilimonas sp.]|nr:ATP-binding protein [Parafilimonas sp.]
MSAIKTINLTPDPRILRMLGQIELKGWQCIAELVDNSIDAMLKSQSLSEQKSIEIYIPTRQEIARDYPLRISDNGIGMSEEELENCLRAGYTSQGTDNLGLFGMGFNIATARLGDVVEVWTSKDGMDYEIGVKIDLIEMQRTKSFVRELTRRRKSFKGSGTSIEISKFHPRAEKLLNRAYIPKELNRVYSKKLLEEYGISIKTNQQVLKPFEFCVWAEERYVEYKGEKIHAIQYFNHDFDDRYYCSRCFIWIDEYETQLSTESVCPNCGMADMVHARKINVNGWVGIQRYNDLEHYGINIIRNGRIIKKLDKSLFTWQDRYNKNNGEPIKDYPIDTTAQGGRFVGEIIADFITPTYTKDSFEETDKLWLDAVEIVRGKAPLQPQIAEKLGFSKNQSPLAKLFYGYRKSFPVGLKNLIPGNKAGQGLYSEARKWADLFYEGDPEYQTDQKWYDAVLNAEFPNDDSSVDPTIFDNRGSGQDENTSGGGDANILNDTENLSEFQELFPGKKEPVAEVNYDLRPLLNEMPYNLSIYNYWPTIEFKAPIIFDAKQASKFDVYINNNHHLFKDFADGWDDLVLMEIATRYYEKLNNIDAWPVSRLYYELKKKYLGEKMLSVQSLVAEAKALITDLQNYLVNTFADKRLSESPALSNEQIKTLKQNYLQVEVKSLANVEEFIQTTGFLKYMDFAYIIDFAKEYPDLIYDEQYFALPYNSLDEDDIKIRQLEQYNGYLNDIKWFIYDLSNFTDVLVKQQKNLIIRNRFSLEFLNAKLA